MAAGGWEVDPGPLAERLVEESFVVLPGQFAGPEAAWTAADPVLLAAAAEDSVGPPCLELEVLSTYSLPVTGSVQRDFQVLHIDFGIPLALSPVADVARYTVLCIDASARGSGAVTRLVPFRALSKQRTWPAPGLLAGLLRNRPTDPDSTEGVLARIVEAADGSTALPDKRLPGFLCGMEFDSLEAEYAFLEAHGLDVASIEQRVILRPGQVLILDNLACAHGRSGKRDDLELHQRCLGFAGMSRLDQSAVLRLVLSRLTGAGSPARQ
jgi:hypothetical protein